MDVEAGGLSRMMVNETHHPDVRESILSESGWSTRTPDFLITDPLKEWLEEDKLVRRFKNWPELREFIQRIGKWYEMESYWITGDPIGKRCDTGRIEAMPSQPQADGVKAEDVRVIVLFRPWVDDYVEYVKMLVPAPAATGSGGGHR